MADNLRVVVVVEHVAIEYGMDSIEEGFEHEKTVEKDLGEEDSVCRDPTRYVFDIISIIGSGSHGTLGSINGIDGDGNTMREAKRLLTEKRVLYSVSHPFITRMFCSLETPNALNFVLEYCPGGDMYFLLENPVKNRLPKDHVLFYATSIVLALRYLHERGILYGDLKPENILLDEACFVRLADFGFAREQMHRSDQCCTSFCGLANYNAPEVVRGTGYWIPSIYSRRDRALLVRKINEEEPSFPHHFSPELCDLLSGWLHKNVSQRLEFDLCADASHLL
ncbi:unnamed protein product [Peronospora farinosa]|uniref:Protein kinase domain-containing protein n=1 Tax=Peronospora farinosa TaxID=134698 RepID=A0ABN8CC36_9STRA|nr:unnamed protein product [Peronospora farinosa]